MPPNRITVKDGPLAGVRVVDMSHVLAGSYCSMHLADLGADVLKIEKIGGDESRHGSAGDAFSPVNRNKRSLAIDVRSKGGHEVMQRLVTRADIFVQNYRPGAMGRLGLDFDTVSKWNPQLVYCSISGFGSTGPYRDRGGFDLVAQGLSGIMSFTGNPDAGPAKAGVPVADLSAGLFAALGCVAAYVNRIRTGEGQHVETSLLESALAYTVWESGLFFAHGDIAQATGTAHRLYAPYEAFQTSDGWITVGAASQSTWQSFASIPELKSACADPRFEDASSRLSHRTELSQKLTPIFLSDTTAAWWERLDRAGVPAGPVNTIAEAWADPQVKAREMAVRATVYGETGTFIAPPVKMTRTPLAVRIGVPRAGEHSRQVLQSLDYAEAEIESLLGSGSVQEAI